jgi:hypothetical protein
MKLLRLHLLYAVFALFCLLVRSQPNQYGLGHAVIVRPQGPLAIYCQPCHRTFATPRSLATHRRAIHRFAKPRVRPSAIERHPWLTGMEPRALAVCESKITFLQPRLSILARDVIFAAVPSLHLVTTRTTGIRSETVSAFSTPSSSSSAFRHRTRTSTT